MNNKKKIEKKKRKLAKRKKKIYNRGTIAIYAKYDCGCCVAEMRFKNLESANLAFSKVRLGNGMKIVDDKGVVHEGIDTFYGFSTDSDEAQDRSLKYLFESLGDF